MEPRLGQEALNRQLQAASTAYHRALAEYKRLMMISAATAHPDDPGLLDGTHALRQALRIHQQARLRYEAALREYTNFTVSSEVPVVNQAEAVQEDLLVVALRVLTCYTDLSRLVPGRADVQRLFDEASADEVGLPIDELAAATVHRERRRRASQP